ncbi:MULTISPECIES: AMP-dependent synthetase/ligase [Mycolicibacterium]|uniref:Long-chain-fatty-acid--CoA ligase n=1 Tax=Mycolicibacterium neoaurum TaxID=1795 RepID=A0AAV2WNT2_MYCNE|nr:AMP-binding protein [Mycolicibacterium neoaurum]TLH57091.1 AMP-binding protein [Mycolicibacterium neoaurum]CDQ45553.1 long-chain-fatty-acid--CoA ligase [Mycolicibacterium neoaurum]
MAPDTPVSSNPAEGNGTHSVPVLQDVSRFEAVPRTFAQLLHDRARHEPDSVAFYTWESGAQHPTTWGEYAESVRRAALELDNLGVGAGDRVAIMSSARAEWVVAALAILSVNAVLVGVYPTSSQQELAQVLETCGVSAIFAESQPALEKVAAIAPRLDTLRAVIGFDAQPAGMPDSVSVSGWHSLLAAGGTLAAADPSRFADLVAEGDIDQPAALFSTSGSTGIPKGVVHTHRTLQFSVLGVAMTYPDIGRTHHDLVGFLGLSHVAPALIGVFAPIMTKLVITYCTMEQRLPALIGVRPTAVVWPPRMHEKLASEVLQTVTHSGRLFGIKYAAAMQIARRIGAQRWADRRPPRYLDVLYGICLKTVFLPLRARVGMDRINVSWTASGSMPPDVAALWHMWGLDLRELYGTTETCGAVLAQWDRPFPRPGTIGKSMPDPRWAARVSADGELQVRTPSLFTGYWNDPQATSEAVHDGWYSTGDLVELDADAEVKIIGRSKDLIKTSGGKSVSPQPIEVKLKSSPLLEEAIVVGEGRKYLTALLAVSAKTQSMSTDERDILLRRWIEGVNSELSRPLQIKDFRVLPRELSAEAGELTLKGTIRRANVVASFAHLVEEMYDGSEQDVIAGQARLIRGDRA